MRQVYVRYSPLKIGGVLYIIAIFQFFVFELVAETLYPGYSVAGNYISDLGATCVSPPSTLNCVVHQPSARFFDTSVSVLGLMLLAGTVFVFHGTRKKAYFVTSAVADVSIFLAGIFPENTGWPHVIDSEFTFFFLAFSLLLTWSIVPGRVVRYLFEVFGILTLFFTVTDIPAEQVGVGGQERILVLCALIGSLTLGGYLTGQESPAPVS